MRLNYRKRPFYIFLWLVGSDYGELVFANSTLDTLRRSGRMAMDIESGRSHFLRPHPHRESAFHSLTRAIIATLTRAGRGGGGGGGGGGSLLTGVGFHHAPRNAWNSNFEGHIGWQSALARPDPFYSTSYYR